MIKPLQEGSVLITARHTHSRIMASWFWIFRMAVIRPPRIFYKFRSTAISLDVKSTFNAWRSQYQASCQPTSLICLAKHDIWLERMSFWRQRSSTWRQWRQTADKCFGQLGAPFWLESMQKFQTHVMSYLCPWRRNYLGYNIAGHRHFTMWPEG